MDWLTWVLILFVVAYSVALTIKTWLPLKRFGKAKDRVVRVSGCVVSFYGEDFIKKGNEKIITHYPIYECVIDGETKKLSGLVRKIGSGDSGIGNKATLLYDKETGELWCERDLPEMWEQTKKRIMIIALILFVAAVISVIL